MVEPSDIISHRSHGMAPFTGTTLDATLRGYRIDTVVLSGVSTNIALPGAATEAVALGYSVVLAEDCTAGATPETHQLQITQHLPLLATITDSESLIASLRPAAPPKPHHPEPHHPEPHPEPHHPEPHHRAPPPRAPPRAPPPPPSLIGIMIYLVIRLKAS